MSRAVPYWYCPKCQAANDGGTHCGTCGAGGGRFADTDDGGRETRQGNALPRPHSPPSGAAMIAMERGRQVGVEGWTPEHDDLHTHGELRRAARCYLVEAGRRDLNSTPPRGWPFEVEAWKPSERIDDLVKAGALIAAEIDRLLRAGYTHGR